MVPSTRSSILRNKRLVLALNLLLILSLACSLPNLVGGGERETPVTSPQPSATPSVPTPTPQPLPPALVEIDPPPGAELPLEGPITLYFNQPMERASVESALAKLTSLEGSLTWVDDATLTIKPSQPLSPDSLVNISFDTGVRSASGLAMAQPVDLAFQTAGYLRLVQRLPEPGATAVDPTSAVVASFNRPVAALGADPASLPAAFTLDPPAEGRGEWLNTSTYVFYPEPGLEGGKDYGVQINPDLLSTEGSPLEEAQGWSFTTAQPRLVSVEPVTPFPADSTPPGMEGQPPLPQNPSAVRLDAQFNLTFNQPMDPTSVEAGFSFQGPDGALLPGDLEWDAENLVLTFRPAALLERSASYRLALDAQAQARGGTPLGEMTDITFQTVPSLAVVRTDPVVGGQKQPYGGVFIVFSGPILNQNLDEYVTVTPAVPNLSTWFDESQLTLNIYGDFDASASYTLSLSPNLADPWGGSLGQPFTLSFSTAPLDPQLFITTGSDVFFLTPRDASMTAQAVNLASVPIARGSVSVDDFLRMAGPNGYEVRSTYHSADEQSWGQPLSLPANRTQPVALPVSPDGSPLAPGLYYLRFTLPQDAAPFPYLLVVSDIQMTYKISATDALVWAVDLRTQQPVASAPITLYDEQGRSLASGQTDSQGIFRTSVSPREDPYTSSYAVLGQPGEASFSVAFSNWSTGISPWDFGLMSNPQPPHLQAYLYTDRPIYRPGQTVYFRAVARQAYNGRYSLPEEQSLQLKVYGGYGNELETLDVPLSAFGTGHGQFVLTADAQPGYYTISIPNDRYGSAVTFQVADYRKPEINLQVRLGAGQVMAGETLSATVDARYFFDAPAGNLPVKWALYAATETFQLPGYQVGPVDTGFLDIYPSFFGAGIGLGTQVAFGEGQTDPQGQLSLDLPTVFEDQYDWVKRSVRQRLTLEVTIQDESGFPVSARAESQANPSEFYIGVRPDVWFGQADQETGFDVQVVDWEGNSAGVRSLRAEFKKVTWTREEASSPYLPPIYTPNYEPVASADFITNADGQARVAFTPPDPGTYQLDISNPDDQNGTQTGLLLWVGGAGQPVWPNLPNQRLHLIADRAEYQPGETAQVFAPNPFGAPALALVTLERGVVLSHQVFTIEAGGANLSFPLSAEEAPNVFVSVTLLGRTADGRPDFRMGYTELVVKPSEQTLNVTLTSEPQRAGPGDEITFDVLVTDAAGQPVQGEFSLAVVDLAALALADPNSPDILPAFYGKQPLGVQTGLGLAVYANRSSTPPAGGGGGGGAEVSTVVRENFPDTAYWNAEVVTGEDGRARVSVPLPDTLTTWQVDLRGLTADTRVGQAQSQVVTSKDLLVRPVTPRFFVAGDHAQLAAIIQNNTGSALQTQVTLQASGFTLDDPASAARSVEVPAGGRARVEWWGAADQVEGVDLVFSASAGGLQDITRPAQGTLPVLRYTAPQTFATSGVLDEQDTRLELVSLPRSFDPQGGSLNVELAPTLATAMLNALDALENFPYDCTEQTVSRFLPNLETYRLMQEFGLESPELEARLERTLEAGLQRLLSRQNFDGGWGWWIDETVSNNYTTAYVIYGLVRAQQAGSTISPDVLQRAVDYLRSSLAAPDQVKEAWELDRLAFQHYVLTQAAGAGFGSGDAAAAEALFKRRDELNPWGLAMLALTYESLDPGSDPARTLLSDLEGQAVRSATGAHWEEQPATSDPALPLAGVLGGPNMTNTLSTSAMVLYTLARRDPGTPLVAEAVRYLMAHRSAGGAWDSTYSTAWSLLALGEVMRGTGELGGEFTYSAALNGAPVASGQANPAGAGMSPPVQASVPLGSLYPDAPNALAIQRGAGNGRLYYTAGLQVFRPVKTVAPLERGVSLVRTYHRVEECTPQSCPGVAAGESSQRLEVRLTLTVPNDVYYLMVEDYIPAGAEILNKELKTSQQGEYIPPEQQPVEPQPQYNPRRPFDEGWGWWLFQAPQVYDDHIAWAADHLPAGTYELTYTLTLLQPGQYQVLPARAWQFYFPEVQGNSAGTVFEITP